MTDLADVRVGVIGTSWWVDSMYLPALVGVGAQLGGVAGRNQKTASELADRWGTHATSAEELLEDDRLDAVVIATPDATHRELAEAAFARGLHVLCEKPLAPTLDEARLIAEGARAAGVITLVPFTYRFMPSHRWVHRLIADGFVGDVWHVGLRYHTGFARDGEYAWRFDREAGGGGVLTDLASHFVDLARWLVGEVTAVSATLSCHVPRSPRPDGSSYRRANDSALLTLRFASGATATVETIAVSHEGDGFGQRHEVDVIGSAGTVRAFNDWRATQIVTGLRAGEPGPYEELPIPDSVWGQARRDVVHDTYRDVFRVDGHMVGDFVRAVATQTPCRPDVSDGLRVQEILDAAARSAHSGGGVIEV